MNIVTQLREASQGREEWRIADPETGAYCMAFSHAGSLNPEREAREWLADHIARFPNSPNANKVVTRAIAHFLDDQMQMEAADTIEALRKRIAELRERVAELQDNDNRLLEVANSAVEHQRDMINVACEPLRKRIAELEADAERYRWLLDNGPDVFTAAYYNTSAPEAVSAAIDAARKE